VDLDQEAVVTADAVAFGDFGCRGGQFGDLGKLADRRADADERSDREAERAASPGQRLVFTGLGIVLAAMNLLFYLAIDRLPLATMGAIEFLGTVILAAIGARTRRNVLALALASGVAVLTSAQLAGQPLGYLFAFANCAGFMLYILLGHRIANTAVGGGGSRGLPLSGIDQLGLAMIIAAAVATPFGFVPAAPAFTHPAWLVWGIGVGVCSSVIPYVTDQLAMARLPRATFSLMLALLPATAAVIGLIVLGQVPTMRDLTGIGLVILGVALHRDPPRREDPSMALASAIGRDTEVREGAGRAVP
jgi:inner membrane transporter RhtA